MSIQPDNFLSYSVWLSLPEATRLKIATLFSINRRGIRETMDARVISDGFVHADLAIITKEKMREIVGIKSDDFYVLFQALIDKVERKLTNTNDVQQEKPDEGKPRAEKKAGRPRKGAKA